MKALLAIVVLNGFSPALAQAQIAVAPPRYGLEASREHSPDGRNPLIAYSREIGGRWVTEFYSMSRLNAESDPVIVARRALDSYEAQEHVQWADSRTCPGLIPDLLRANDFTLPIVLIPLDEASRARRAAIGYPAPPAPDGPGPYVFWATTFGTVGNELRFSTFGGAWHDWANQMENTLEPCWNDAMPTTPPRDGG